MQKTCIITGGSSGIGLEISKIFIKDSYKVFNLDIQSSNIGEFVPCDVTSINDIKSAIRTIANKTNSIDVLITSAGVHHSANIENTTEEDFYRVFDINVKGVFSAIKNVIPIMKKQKQGAIIVIASDQSLIAKHNSCVYNISKHALASIVKTTALDYSKYGIRVNGICPGTVETPLYHKAIERYCKKNNEDINKVNALEKNAIPLGRLGKPEEIAAFAKFLAGDNAKFITGSLQVIDGGYTCQ